MNFALNTDAATLSPVALFLQASLVVQIVMAGLLLASIWTWGIIVSASVRLGGAARRGEQFESVFAGASDIDAFYRQEGATDAPVARVFSAGVTEWRRSTTGGVVDREGTRERLTTVMGAAVASEIDGLAARLGLLATIGSVAPFVGLFGTVWGIMYSFARISAAQSTSLAVVAPGIAEALFATALGLFAAIPAVVAYNHFSQRLNRIEARLYRFADEFHVTLSRQLETPVRRA